MKQQLRMNALRAAAAAAVLASILGAVSAGALAQGTDGSANLAAAKSDSPDPVTSGTPLTYTIEITNHGPNPATNVALTDQLPTGVDFVSADPSLGTCSVNGRKVSCDAPELAADATLTVTIVVNVTKKSGSITNS